MNQRIDSLLELEVSTPGLPALCVCVCLYVCQCSWGNVILLAHASTSMTRVSANETAICTAVEFLYITFADLIYWGNICVLEIPV